MDMTEKDFRLLKKIAENQNELRLFVKEFQIKSSSDLSKISPTIRRGVVGFISDIFELTRPLSDSVMLQISLNQVVIKQFRNAATHQYGTVTDTMVYACLIHCLDKSLISKLKALIENYDSDLT